MKLLIITPSNKKDLKNLNLVGMFINRFTGNYKKGLFLADSVVASLLLVKKF